LFGHTHLENSWTFSKFRVDGGSGRVTYFWKANGANVQKSIIEIM
jgi:hypothetical protein